MRRETVHLTALILFISTYFFLPFLLFEYGVPSAETLLAKMFAVNHFDNLRAGRLAFWNSYVGLGQTAIVLNHIPINLYSPMFLAFGFNDLTFYTMQLIDFALLLYGFIYLGRLAGWTDKSSLISGVFYFGVGFVMAYFPIGFYNAVFVTAPYIVACAIELASEFSGKNLFKLSLLVFWQMFGNSPIFWFIALIGDVVILSLVLSIYSAERMRFISKMFLAGQFIGLGVLSCFWQIYYILDTIKASGRINSGLKLGLLSPNLWGEFAESFWLSSYFIIGATLATLYLIKICIANMSVRIFLYSCILILSGLYGQTIVVEDLSSIFGHFEVYLSVGALFGVGCISWRRTGYSVFMLSLRFLTLLALLSFYLYSPNIGGGFEYQLFSQFPFVYRVLFISLIAFPLTRKDLSKNYLLGCALLIFVYFLRAHAQIILLRGFAVLWHMNRDTHLVSIGIALLFAEGIKESFQLIGRPSVQKLVSGLALCSLALIVRQNFYTGKIHNYVNKINTEKEIQFKELSADLRSRIANEGFFRLAQFDVTYDYRAVPGSLTNDGVFESSIYSNGVSSHFRWLHYHILSAGKYEELPGLAGQLPYQYYPANVFRVFNIVPSERLDSSYFRNALILDFDYDSRTQFFWNLSQTKYILKYKSPFEGTAAGNFNLLKHYEKLGAYLYENKSVPVAHRYGFIETDSIGYSSIVERSNADDISDVEEVFSMVKFTDDSKLLFGEGVGENQTIVSNFSKPVVIVDLESWNSNWKFEDLDEEPGIYRTPERVFHIFRGYFLEPGRHRLRIKYSLPYFRLALVISTFSAIFLFLGWLIAAFYGRKTSLNSKLTGN